MPTLTLVDEKNNVSHTPYDVNVANVRHAVYRSSNPNPVIVLAFAFVIVLIIYYIYVANVKTCFDGLWTDNVRKYRIKHNKWNDTATITRMSFEGHSYGHWTQKSPSRATVRAKINGSILQFDCMDRKTGVLDGDKINWLDQTVWFKVNEAKN